MFWADATNAGADFGASFASGKIGVEVVFGRAAPKPGHSRKYPEMRPGRYPV